MPDLKGIARNYLACLEKCLNDDTSTATADYDWMMLEPYDQTIRNYLGGRMGERLADPDLPKRDFLIQRIRDQAKKIQSGRPNRRSIWHWEAPTFRSFLSHGAKGLAEWFLNRVNPTAYQELRHGRFRLCGEVHLWMYDRYSLARLLRSKGFKSPRKCEATESAIPEWQEYHLDANKNGDTWKPDSLFIESQKPV